MKKNDYLFLLMSSGEQEMVEKTAKGIIKRNKMGKARRLSYKIHSYISGQRIEIKNLKDELEDANTVIRYLEKKVYDIVN